MMTVTVGPGSVGPGRRHMIPGGGAQPPGPGPNHGPGPGLPGPGLCAAANDSESPADPAAAPGGARARRAASLSPGPSHRHGDVAAAQPGGARTRTRICHGAGLRRIRSVYKSRRVWWSKSIPSQLPTVGRASGRWRGRVTSRRRGRAAAALAVQCHGRLIPSAGPKSCSTTT